MKALMLAVLGGAIALAGVAIGEGKSYASDDLVTNDISVCYKVLRKTSGGSDDSWYHGGYDREHDRYERLNLNIKAHSYLWGDEQPVYDVQGKYVTSRHKSYDGDMETAHGTLITNDSSDDYYDVGARLGVETMGVLRGANNYTFDCTSPYHDRAPDYFYCKVRGDGDRHATSAILVQVHDDDDYCNVFRDGKYGY